MKKNNKDVQFDEVSKDTSKSNKKKNSILICIIILLLVPLIIFLLLPKNSSILDIKEEVVAYLEKNYNDDNFEIIEKVKLNEKICNSTGYSWSVKSNKSGVIFNVYEAELHNYHTGECAKNVIDNYEEKTRDVFYENEKLNSDNKYHYIFYPNDYNSEEELANKIYGLIDKYYLKKKPYAVRLIVKVGDNNVAIMPEEIDSPKDIIDNYLGGN